MNKQTKVYQLTYIKLQKKNPTQLYVRTYLLSPNVDTSIATSTGPPPFPISSERLKSAKAVPRFSGYVTF